MANRSSMMRQLIQAGNGTMCQHERCQQENRPGDAEHSDISGNMNFQDSPLNAIQSRRLRTQQTPKRSENFIVSYSWRTMGVRHERRAVGVFRETGIDK